MRREPGTGCDSRCLIYHEGQRTGLRYRMITQLLKQCPQPCGKRDSVIIARTCANAAIPNGVFIRVLREPTGTVAVVRMRTWKSTRFSRPESHEHFQIRPTVSAPRAAKLATTYVSVLPQLYDCVSSAAAVENRAAGMEGNGCGWKVPEMFTRQL